MGKTIKYVGLLDADAFCHDCPWKAESRNSMGLGALHHKRTGHTVSIQTILGMTLADENSKYVKDRIANGRG